MSNKKSLESFIDEATQNIVDESNEAYADR